MENKLIDVKALQEGFYIYGNKGNVWNNTAHIYKPGVGNLCGTPALATNWARINGLTHVGCPGCIQHYESLIQATS